jgi:hypothetical protein
MIIVYAAVKFLAYAAWCAVGLWVVHPADAGIMRAARYGVVRWLLGLAFGVAIFFLVGPIEAADAARLYVSIYLPVRVVEWGIMAVLIARHLTQASRSTGNVTLVLWCVGGVLVSFLTDLASPEGMAGRFCVGRCLC